MPDSRRRPDEEWARRLTPEQFRITRQAGTERAFSGALWDSHEPGVFRCICCDAELFTSAAQFESGTGWPSFTAPTDPEAVDEHLDLSHGMRRTEVLCAACDAHLGHVFEDGPAPTGRRYCINSAALRLDPEP